MEAAFFAAVPATIVAMGGILKMVLNSSQRTEDRFERFLENHLSKNTEALVSLTEAVQAMRRDVSAVAFGKKG